MVDMLHLQTLLAGQLPSWFTQFANIIREPLTDDVGEWGVKLEVLRSLTLLASRFTRLAQPHMGGIVPPCWQLLEGAKAAHTF